ncbi:MAG: helix-turn-helix transcriptional regulator [Legionella sp.]
MINDLPQILRYEDLQKLVKVSRSSLARWEAKSLFPCRVPVGESGVGWCREQVQQWLQNRYKNQEV